MFCADGLSESDSGIRCLGLCGHDRDVVLDRQLSRSGLSSRPDGLLLHLAIDPSPDLHAALADDHVHLVHANARLGEFFLDCGTHLGCAGTHWRLSVLHNQSMQEVRAADDPRQPSVAQNRNALDAMAVENISDVSEIGLVANGRARAAPEFRRLDGSLARVLRRARIVREGPAPDVRVPLVVQVSRWDRLKGFGPLLDAFARLKHGIAPADVAPRQRRRLSHVRLVLAGPEPAAVADDPEAVCVLDELIDAYRRLPHWLQEDVAIVSLPMASRAENALMVNALQRCASIVVQNSLREGFGLTVTEAMWKQRGVLGSRACGIRAQIRDGIDGRLVTDSGNAAKRANVPARTRCMVRMVILSLS